METDLSYAYSMRNYLYLDCCHSGSQTAARIARNGGASRCHQISTIEKKHSMMVERQKSHIMDDKHTATRDKMAEDVEARITAETALRQQFDLEKRTF